VIYKKFNIACPLETVYSNYSANAPISDDICIAKFFTINHEVHHVTAHVIAHVNQFMRFQERDINLLLGLQTAYTIPILAFAFVCHPEVLPIYTELSK
ncbi:hypothetical protein XENOCAPTIV_024962, partial [Xenoophorus captivus]